MGFLSTITETVYFVAETFNPFWFLPGWFRSWITYAFSTLGMLGSFLALFLYRNQRCLEFQRIPGKIRRGIETLIKAEDHTELHCWLIKQPDSFSAPTIVFFQENAGNFFHKMWPLIAKALTEMNSFRQHGPSIAKHVRALAPPFSEHIHGQLPWVRTFAGCTDRRGAEDGCSSGLQAWTA
eukprot:765298-Hanusia_phi.AAC.2